MSDLSPECAPKRTSAAASHLWVHAVGHRPGARCIIPLREHDGAAVNPGYCPVNESRDRVAQTVISESAFNDAMGAIVTFGVLAVAMGTGEFSFAS
jgi:chorismate synthase